MNFLAHLYLSRDSEKIKVGNFIADWVKGNNFRHYHIQIQQGIFMHRAIDSFTDKHEYFLKSKAIFRPTYNHYSGIISDIIFDHFLTKKWENFSKVPLRYFINDTYLILNNYSSAFPPGVKRILPSLIYYDWIAQYGSFYGLKKVLNRMASRTSLPSYSDDAVLLLKNNYCELENNFDLFWADMLEMIDTCFFNDMLNRE